MSESWVVSDPGLEIGLRPSGAGDEAFLARVYASTRQEEMAATGWPPGRIDAFLRSQFQLQHSQYLSHYAGASFDLVLVQGLPAGRLYVHRTAREIRLMDIALLPEFRGRGVGGRLLGALVREADERGLPLSLHVECYNPFRDHYRRLGFKEGAMHGIYLYMERPASGAGKGSR